MKQRLLAKRLLTLCLMLGMTTLLVGQPAIVDAQGESPDAYGSAVDVPADTVYIAADGNVGIGTLTPLAPIDVGGTQFRAGWKSIVATHPDQSGISVENRGKALFLFNNGSQFKLDAYDYGGDRPVPLDIQVSSQGNVGIQTTSPETPLHLNTRTDEQGLKITKDGKDTAVFLHIAESDYGYLDLGGGTRIRGNGQKSQFSGRIETPRIIVDGTTTTKVLQIIGGADLAEPFDIVGDDAVEPGMVVAIDSKSPGQLRVADSAYDRKVAGIVSGAGGVNSGLVMQQEGTLMAGSHPVALTGRVYVWADANSQAIEPGDLLTTSDTPGHAMKVTDYASAQGAIIGKAMTGLDAGAGLVLVLVTLQ